MTREWMVVVAAYMAMIAVVALGLSVMIVCGVFGNPVQP